jgi:hypothetical protein
MAHAPLAYVTIASEDCRYASLEVVGGPRRRVRNEHVPGGRTVNLGLTEGARMFLNMTIGTQRAPHAIGAGVAWGVLQDGPMRLSRSRT